VTLKAFLLVKTIPITISHVDLKHQTRLKQCKDLLLSVTLVDFQFPLDKLLEKFHITKINSVALISLTSSFRTFQIKIFANGISFLDLDLFATCV
jgi:hypothetical protein